MLALNWHERKNHLVIKLREVHSHCEPSYCFWFTFEIECAASGAVR